jgi:hypothetical protein
MNEINFKQEREFGDLFNATFTFIGNEFKSLGKAILYFVVPLLLIASIVGVFAGLKMQESMSSIQSGAMSGENPGEILSNYPFGYIFLSSIIAMIASTILTTTVLGYIKLYVNNGKDNFSLTELWGVVSRNFLRVLGATFVAGIVIAFGIMLCFLPGVYLGVSMCLILPIMIFEEKSLGEAFSRSFKLTKNNFWMILGGLVVILIIFYILSLIFSIPSAILGFKNIFMKALESQEFDFDFGISYYITNAIASLLTYIASAIPTTFIAFIYYSQVEQNEKPSLEEKIEQISAEE